MAIIEEFLPVFLGIKNIIVLEYCKNIIKRHQAKSRFGDIEKFLINYIVLEIFEFVLRVWNLEFSGA